ncbi:MAG: thiol-disulfide isomerase [Pirellulaceae bacterium]|nr:MAG: thiol-disulfide isomerase [Pirellulaceae bacterium]
MVRRYGVSSSLIAFLCGIAMIGWMGSPILAVADDGDPAARIDDLELVDHYGAPVPLEQWKDAPILVVAFLGVECPLARLYGPRLNQLYEEYRDRGVMILGIDSNRQDSLKEMTAYVTRHHIGFPFLKDVGHRLADRLGATRTPEVFVLDAHRRVRYQGRIDDQYGVGYSRYDANRSDLRNAVEALLAGRPIAVAQTPAVGCIIGRLKESKKDAGVTYYRDVAPILHRRCAGCHREGEIGPFSMLTYEDVAGWEDTILEVIDDGRMPPWNANPEYGHFRNDPRLTYEEIGMLRDWVAAGAPAGDPEEAAPLPEFVSGWQIGTPDEIIYMRDQPFDVPAEGVVDYQRFVVDPGWQEDRYVVAVEARPDNRAVVHHILVYIIPPGKGGVDLRSVLVGYAPGSLPVHYGEDVAILVPAGSRLLFELHYTPNGTPQRDRSYIGVRFGDPQQVKSLLQGHAVLNARFEIPPGAAHHEVMAQQTIRDDCVLLSMTPHMHLRGKAFRYEALYPDGTKEILLDVPRYDFNWQLKYILAEPKSLPRGTRIRCTAVYDNSENNLVNPDPTRAVRWGDQSWEEMMIGFFDTLPTRKE